MRKVDGKINQNGFSLMEVMIAVGMMGMVVLGVFATIQLGASNSAKVDQSVAIYDIEDQARTYLKSQAACTETFKNTVIDLANVATKNYAVSVPQIRGPSPGGGADGPVILPPATPMTAVMVASMDLRSFQLMGSNASNKSYFATVHVTSIMGNRPSSTWTYDPAVTALPAGLKYRTTDIPVFFVVDNTGKFTSCGVGYGDLSKTIADDMCTQFGGTRSPATGLCLSGVASPVRRRCPSGSVVSGIAADGTVSCQSLPSLKGCKPGLVVQRMGADGNSATCIPIADAVKFDWR